MTDTRVHTLTNGCKVILRPTPDKQILSVVACLRWGARDDKPGQAGLAHLMARLLTKGTRTRSAFDIAETMESVGGSIEPDCSHDWLGIETQIVAEDWPVAVELLSDCLFEPIFPAQEFDKERSVIQAEILRAEDDKFTHTYRKLAGLLYRGHPYAVVPEGEVETLARLERRQAEDLHAAVIRPERMLLVAVGNVPEEEFLAEVERRWPKESLAESPVRLQPDCPPGAGQGETLTMTKDVEQAFIIMGYPAPRPGTPESSALRVACGVLGEGMSARLFARLRDRDHLAYAVGSSIVARDLASHLILFIGTGPATAEAARQGLLREVDGLLSEPPDEAEVERARRYILGKYLIARQTNSALAHSMAASELMGLGWNWGEGFPERIKAVTGQAALEATRKYLTKPAIAVLRPAGA